jgi:hypothetical protein
MSVPFKPDMVADLVLEADKLTGLSDGAAVLNWPSTGKITSYAATGVSGTAPLYKAGIINGLPVVRFSGAQLLKVAGLAMGTGLSLIFTAILNATANYPMFVIYGDSPVNDWELRGSGGSSILQYIGNGGNIASGGDMLSWHIAEAVYLSASTTATLYIDGTSQGAVYVGSGAVATGSYLWLGQRSDGYPLTGDFASVILCTGDLASSDQAMIEGYLAWKYNLVGNLPANHPYKSAPPTVPGGGSGAALLAGL